MDEFKKDNDIMSGKGESEDIEWITINGTHIPLKDGQTKQDAVVKFSQNHLINKKKNDIVDLPKQEYAELCSAIRTKYANDIPTRGGTFLANDYYRFSYDKQLERIVCKAKISIVGNEEKIKIWENYNV